MEIYWLFRWIYIYWPRVFFSSYYLWRYFFSLLKLWISPTKSFLYANISRALTVHSSPTFLRFLNSCDGWFCCGIAVLCDRMNLCSCFTFCLERQGKISFCSSLFFCWSYEKSVNLQLFITFSNFSSTGCESVNPCRKIPSGFDFEMRIWRTHCMYIHTYPLTITYTCTPRVSHIPTHSHSDPGTYPHTETAEHTRGHPRKRSRH